MNRLTKLSDRMWRRHAHPWSVWTRLLSVPLVFLPLWNRSWKQGLGLAAWLAINPFLFPEPKDRDGWAARAIRGERRWVQVRPVDAALAVQSAGSVALLGGCYAAYHRRLGPTLAAAGLVLGCNAFFLHRMARTVGRTPRADEAALSGSPAEPTS